MSCNVPEFAVCLPKGDTTPFDVTVTTDGTTPADITGSTFVLTINDDPSQSPAVSPALTVAGVIQGLPTAGLVRFELSETESEAFDVGTLFYDIVETQASGVIEKILFGTWETGARLGDINP